MADQPLVSAITIFLNAERFIEEAIESVFAQTYRRWELLLVDDGSTDGSTAIARRYAAAHPDRVRYLEHANHENRGMSAARNLGIRHARGSYIAFLDADDVWLPEKLGEQVAVLEREPEAGLVYGRTLIWHSWNGAPPAQDFFYDLGVEPDRLYRPPRLFELLLENKAQSPTTCNALMRRALFEQVGGFEEVFGGMFEDQAFFAKALLEAPAYVDGRVWARYRQHPTSCAARSAAAGADNKARRRFLRWLDGYHEEQPEVDARARRALHREVMRNRLLAARHGLRRAVRRWRGRA
jgi:glycosyltransferase involved in cell wall biosynthesis